MAKGKTGNGMTWLKLTKHHFKVLRKQHFSEHGDAEENLHMGEHGVKLLPDVVPNGTLPPLRTLVLDLDETLVHSKLSPGGDCSTYVRPGVPKFLKAMSSSYEIVVFTSSLPEYADRIIDNLLPSQYIAHRLYRDATIQLADVYVKDISRLNRPLSRTILIDNSAEAYLLQPKNAIPIKPFLGDNDDEELMRLESFLLGLVENDIKDVTAVLSTCYEELAVEKKRKSTRRKIPMTEPRPKPSRRRPPRRTSTDTEQREDDSHFHDFRTPVLHWMENIQTINLGAAENILATSAQSETVSAFGTPSEKVQFAPTLSGSLTKKTPSPKNDSQSIEADSGMVASREVLLQRVAMTAGGSESHREERRAGDRSRSKSSASIPMRSVSLGEDTDESKRGTDEVGGEVNAAALSFQRDVLNNRSDSSLEQHLLGLSMGGALALPTHSFSSLEGDVFHAQPLSNGLPRYPSSIANTPLVKLTWTNKSFRSMLQMMSPPPSHSSSFDPLHLSGDAASTSSEEEAVEREAIFDLEE